MPVSIRNFYHKLAGDLYTKEETKQGASTQETNKKVLKPDIKGK